MFIKVALIVVDLFIGSSLSCYLSDLAYVEYNVLLFLLSVALGLLLQACSTDSGNAGDIPCTNT